MLKTYKLQDICLLEKGKQINTSSLKANKPYPYINGGITPSGYYDNYNTEENTVTVSEGGASCGFVNYMTEKFWCGCHCYKLINPKVTPKYLYYALKANQASIMELRSGAAMPNIKKSIFVNMSIKLNDDKVHQNRVISLLDSIQRLIEIKNQELKSLDNLIKSRFIEMFEGKNYPTLLWNDVFITKTGKLDANAMQEDGQYPFFTCAKEIFRINKYAFDQEALLLAGNNAAGKYDVKYYKGKFNAYQRTYVLSLKGDWSYQMFRCQLEEKLEYLREQSKGCNTKFITLKILSKIEFIIPPISLQNEFADFVKQIDKLKFV